MRLLRGYSICVGSGDIGNGLRWEAIDKYPVKLITSGYLLVTVRRISLNGIKVYRKGEQ